MIRLTLIGERDVAAFVTAAPYFRIVDGMVWTGPSLEGEVPLVRHVDGRWKHGNLLWAGMRFEGKIRLIFGVPRDPSGVSDELDGVSIVGTALSANGIPFAVYDQASEMWRGAGLSRWWHAFRIESAGFRQSTLKPMESGEGTAQSRSPGQAQGGSAPVLN
jgi:hypothetical protein